MQRSVKKLTVPRRLMAYLKSEIDIEYAEYERLANLAIKINAEENEGAKVC